MLAFLAAVALVSGVAIGAWFRPLPDNKAPAPPAPTYTDHQIADAKASVCAAFGKVHQAVSENTGRSGGDDPTAILAVAANARIALYDGGDYLLTELAEQPATPPDLAKAVRSLASVLQELAIDYLAAVPDPEQESSHKAVETANATVYGMCK
jgi:hypothetical protein